MGKNQDEDKEGMDYDKGNWGKGQDRRNCPEKRGPNEDAEAGVGVGEVG